MARRTSEEVLAQREAWLARKARREAGEDLPYQSPLKPGETAPEVEASEATPEPETAPEPENVQPEPVAAAEPALEAPAPIKPQSPAQRRSPEEVRAQREAYLAAKVAREAGQAAAPPPAPAPTPTPAPAPAEAPAAKPAAPRPRATPRPAPAQEAAPEPEPGASRITRRELLNYAWLASIGLLTVETVGLSLWFAFPNFKPGQFGGQFPIGTATDILPEVNSGPVPYTDGKFWLVNVDDAGPNGEPRKGVLALFKVCTHLGCLYEWVPVTVRFECPCHGSKFALTGDYIGGPARRSLDRFVIQAVSPDGTIKETDAEGNPLIINGDETLIIDTGQRIPGSSDITPA